MYGILIGIGIVLSIEYIQRINKDISYTDILLVLVSTLLGARALFLLHNIPEILNKDINPLAVWQGGLAFYGALCGLLLALYIISKRKKKEFFHLTDTFLLFLPLIHAIGRVGNFFNYELYGKPTDVAWAIHIPLVSRVSEYIQYTHFHPVFLYEMILNIFNFLLLTYIFRKSPKKGLITGIYLLNYSLIRLLLNRLRIDKEYILGIESSDIFSVVFLLLGILLIYSIMKKKRQLAKVISTYTIPVLIAALTTISVIYIPSTLLNTSLLVLFTLILPLITTLLFKYLKYTSDFSVTKREERPLLYTTFLLYFLISLLISILSRQFLLIQMYTILTLTLALGILITLFWKISFHMLISTLSIFFLSYLIGHPYMYLLFLLLPLIGWSRIELKKHTLNQVIAGVLLPLLSIAYVLTLSKFW
jgi:prolipoprotein diacylglyceryl transferase